MTPKLAQVLNTLAHEIRTPLSVSQGYIKLFLDGRLKDGDDLRRAMEQTRQALGTLATLCVDMGKVGALSESESRGIPVRLAAADFVNTLREHEDVAGAAFTGDAGSAAIVSASHRDLALAMAIASKAAFDEARDAPHGIEARAEGTSGLIVVAGATASLPVVQPGPGAPGARAFDFTKGGKGLRLIWAAFVLDKHGVETWTCDAAPASIGFRIPVISA